MVSARSLHTEKSAAEEVDELGKYHPGKVGGKERCLDRRVWDKVKRMHMYDVL